MPESTGNRITKSTTLRPSIPAGRSHLLRILFFSRGRGHGHAIPDMAIVEAMLAAGYNIDVEFVSYAEGATTFKVRKWPVHNLGLASNNPYLETLFKCRDVIIGHSPDIVIAHEEFAALAASALQNIPSVFIGTWFPSDGGVFAESVGRASSILFLERPGLFPVPTSCQVTPIYLGPMLRRFKYGLFDRSRLRRQMLIGRSELVIVVVIGGAASEKSMPISDVILSSFLQLTAERKRLIWISSKDYDDMCAKTANIKSVEVVRFSDPIEKLLVLADVVITKGTHGITLECAALGVPSLSLSPAQNPIDEILVPRIASNTSLYAHAVDPNILTSYLHKTIKRRSSSRREAAFDHSCTPEEVASTLMSEIGRLLPKWRHPILAKGPQSRNTFEAG